MHKIKANIITLLLLAYLLVLLAPTHCQPLSPTTSPTIVLQYTNTILNNTLQNITIYNNSILNTQFVPAYFLSCANVDLFIVVQHSNQFSVDPHLSIVVDGYGEDVIVDFGTQYRDPSISPTSQQCGNSTSAGEPCTIGMSVNCSNRLWYNVITANVRNLAGISLLQFQFNFICDQETFQNYQPVEWGVLIMVIFSIFLIFVCSKFQKAPAYSNAAFYINYWFIIGINLLSVVEFVLIAKSVPHIANILNYICIGGSFLLGIPALMVCFGEGAYATKWEWLRLGCQGKLRCRIMDVVGIGIGAGALCGWYFSHTNYIISDLIFIAIYVAMIKLVKFGSLKMSLAAFACSLILSCVFLGLSTETSVFLNLSNFNNPLFLVAPRIARVPNHKCSWYFLLTMAYPGMFLAYLERFDNNRSSLIYSPTFVVCYGVFSIIWFIIGSLIKAPLPYDLFTLPVSMVMLLLFANRRGQLEDLWEGRFFDEHRSYYQNQKSLMQNLRPERTASGVTYEREMFDHLAYRESSEGSGTSKGSKFSQIMKGAVIAHNSTELRHIYSQGQQIKSKNWQKGISSNETQRISKSKQNQQQNEKEAP